MRFTVYIRAKVKPVNDRVPTFFSQSNSLTSPRFPNNFPWFFLSFYQDILVKKKTYLFFLNVAFVTLVYANIASLSAISWQLLRFNSLKKHFPQIYRFKKIWKKVPWFWLKIPVWPDFPNWKKSLKFPWSVGTLKRTSRDRLFVVFLAWYW